MTSINALRVSEDQIRQLKEESLVDLLDILLVLEAREHSIPLQGIGVSLRTKTPDGGLDGTANWTPPPAKTQFLPKPEVGFQCKAEKLSPVECAKELVASNGALKPSVRELLQKGGAYVLFTIGSGGVKWNKDREEGIRRKLIELKAPKPKTAKIEIFGADRIRKWVDSHLAASVFVSSVTGHPLIPGLKTWKEWKTREESKWEYFPDSKVTQLEKTIREELQKPRICLRLNGLSGLGKTRLLIEALAPSTVPDPLSASVIYIDAEHQMMGLAHYISEWKRLGRSGTLIVDNCTKELHAAIQKEVADPSSRFSALTVGLDPNETIAGSRSFVLEPSDAAHVKKLVQHQVQGISETDAERIARWAGGFPFFALLLCDAWLARSGLGSVQLDDLQLSKHLWGDSGTPLGDQEQVIKICSLFESINVGAADSVELNFLTAFTGVSKREFMKTLKAFERRGTVERYGNYVRLRPHPLALRLCAEWWRSVDKSMAMELLDSVPESLVEPLCERLSTLDFLEEARELTKELCGAYGPFGSAEMLSSERGARILRALTEVNPEICANALSRVISSIPLTELDEKDLPRRQWVWTLELLLFRKSTYRTAIEILQKLAAAETETYSNSATGLWEQSFHIYLPGTEASLSERLDYLNTFFAQSDQDFPPALFTRAIDKAFEASHFSRSGGAEDQGSGPRLNDYSPKGRVEILGYWERALELSLRAVGEGRVSSEAIMPAFSSSMRGLLLAGAEAVVSRMVQEGGKWRSPWTEAIEALRDTRRFDSRKGNKARRVVDLLIEQLEPSTTDIAGRLVTVVTSPSWTDLYETEPSGATVEVGEARAEALGEECGKEFSGFAAHLHALFSGEQRMGWAFGKGLARTMTKPEIFIDLAKRALLNVDVPDGNPVVLGGFLSELRKAGSPIATEAIETFWEEPGLRIFTPRLLAGMLPTAMQLVRLAKYAEAGLIATSALTVFGYGRALDHLKPDEVGAFARRIYEHSPEGAEVGFFILYMYVFGKPEHWTAVRGVMRQFILAGKLAALEAPSSHIVHEWGRVCVKLLEEAEDLELAGALANQIVEMTRSNRSWRHDLPSELGETLFSRFGAVIWPVFGAVLLGPSDKGRWKLEHFLSRSGRRDDADRRGPIDHIELEILRGWISQHAAGAVEIARLALVATEDEDSKYVWSPIGKLLLDNCGTEAVLSAITSNLLTGSWSGSREPYLRRTQDLLRPLSGHKSKHVRKWAIGLIGALESDIARERDEYDARRVGRW